MRGGELAITETAVAAAPALVGELAITALVGELAITALVGLELKQLFDAVGDGEKVNWKWEKIR